MCVCVWGGTTTQPPVPAQRIQDEDNLQRSSKGPEDGEGDLAQRRVLQEGGHIEGALPHGWGSLLFPQPPSSPHLGYLHAPRHRSVIQQQLQDVEADDEH